MKIEKINIANLRNHVYSEIEFCDGLNIFYGLNGSGKTSILEAISVCAFSKSFMPVKESTIIRQNSDFYSISANARNDYGIPYHVFIRNIAGSKKEIRSSLGDNLSPKDLIGELPLIVLYPDNKSITFGSPADRRDFFDRLLSQASRIYLDELIKLKKILRQRNNLLFNAKTDYHFDKTSVDVWTEMLLKTGTELTFRRAAFIAEFKPFFHDAYSFISAAKENVDIEYCPQGISPSPINLKSHDGIFEYYKEYANKVSSEEFRRGVTLFGPQKDDMNIIINNGIARDIASQGQHKSLLIAMKFSEFNFLKSIKNETPLVLLDDIFSELDRVRALKTLDLLNKNFAQTFITLTDIDAILQVLPSDVNTKIFKVEDGVVADVTNKFK